MKMHLTWSEFPVRVGKYKYYKCILSLNEMCLEKASVAGGHPQCLGRASVCLLHVKWSSGLWWMRSFLTALRWQAPLHSIMASCWKDSLQRTQDNHFQCWLQRLWFLRSPCLQYKHPLEPWNLYMAGILQMVCTGWGTSPLFVLQPLFWCPMGQF